MSEKGRVSYKCVHCFIPGVKDNGDKFTTGVRDTGDKLTTDVKDTADKFLGPFSFMTVDVTVIHLAPASMTPEIN